MFLGSTHNAWISGGTDKIETVTMFTIYGETKTCKYTTDSKYTGEKFSLTPLHVRPGGGLIITVLSLGLIPPGHTEAIFQNPPSLWIAHLVFLILFVM